MILDNTKYPDISKREGISQLQMWFPSQVKNGGSRRESKGEKDIVKESRFWSKTSIETKGYSTNTFGFK